MDFKIYEEKDKTIIYNILRYKIMANNIYWGEGEGIF